MRRLGVYGANLPTKKERSVEPADFSIAGLIGYFDRQYNKAFQLRSDIEGKAIFGEQTNKNAYGWDCLNGFFANLKGASGSIFVLSLVGAGAVQASLALKNGNSEDILTVKASYQGEDEYGVFANRTGVAVEQGAYFETAISAYASKVFTVDSCAGLHVGDIVCAHYVGSSTGTDTFTTVVALSESAKTVEVADAVTMGDIADYVLQGIGFKLKTYRKSLTGIISEVDKTLGEVWCTLNTNDPDHFVSQVFEQSSYIKVAVNTSATTIDKILPVTAVLAYLSGGTTGTMPANVNAWKPYFNAFDTLPIRILALCETANDQIQSALEQYCRNREDNPIAVLVVQYGLATKQDMINAGNFFQRSDEVDALVIGNWLGVPNPFSTSPVAPDREIPCVGHVMGEWIYSIEQNGIHSSPARKNCALSGVNSVIGYTADKDEDRTDLADAGINVIQKMKGKGFILRNAFTPSTAVEFRYSNAVIERNFIKVSCVDSLQDSENTPNTIANVREDRMAVLQFMNKIWRSGSNGSTKEGETFGQYEKDDGSLSTTEDAFEVIADASNNSVATLQAGERNIDIWFMFPAPAGSIKVGVGLIYKTIA
jgi:hypothetical protein